jgi:hypothetical protein
MNQKKTPVSRFILRVASAEGTRGNSPALRQVQTVRAFLPFRAADARRVTMGIIPITTNIVFNASSGWLHTVVHSAEDDLIFGTAA